MKGFRKCSVLLVLLSLSIYFFGQTLDIQIKNIRVGKGQLCVAVFANEAGFEAEKTFFATKCRKGLVVNGNFDLKIPIHPGKYGISVLDDENENGKMEYRLFGIPCEGFGFSNYYQKGIQKPTFNDFSFTVEKNEIKIIIVKMKYF